MNPFSRKRFLQTAIGLSVVMLIIEVWSGFYRNPIPDVYRGSIHMGQEHGKNLLIKDVEVTLNIPSGGYFFSPPSWIGRSDVNINLSGKGVDSMKKLGFKIEQEDGDHYVNMSCNVVDSKTATYGIWQARVFDLSFARNSQCKDMEMIAKDFDNFEIVTKSPSGMPIYAKLERDSRIGIIQQLVMRFNYSPNNYGGSDTFRSL